MPKISKKTILRLAEALDEGYYKKQIILFFDMFEISPEILDVHGVNKVHYSRTVMNNLYNSKSEEDNRKLIEMAISILLKEGAHEDKQKTIKFNSCLDEVKKCLQNDGFVIDGKKLVSISNNQFEQNKDEADLEKSSKPHLNKQIFIEKLSQCERETNSQKKGKLLEEFTIELFSTIEGFTLFNKNLRTINEEFDAVFQNNIDSPFFQSLTSPHILFECKNWTRKVSITEVKAFSSDLDDHKNLTRVGLFLSISGFEAGCNVQQVRKSSSDNILILVTGAEIKDFLESKKETLEWFKDLISSGIK
ncbi:TPA: restriction endonuclease [Methanosarcinaceae archaeon]|nr:restriction endonuclease [Methanosarcinaceae archaeon]